MEQTANDVITQALLDSELDCSKWPRDVRLELAAEIIISLYKAGFRVIREDHQNT
jgi:hypothetical protein